jgi:hypothetical protein
MDLTQISPAISETLFYSYSKIFHRPTSIYSGIAAITSFMLCFSSSMVVGLEIENLLLRNTHTKQSQGERSGEPADHEKSPPQEMTYCGKISRRTFIDALAVWAVAPSC